MKNDIWNKIKSKYPNLALVGEDDREHPEGTLIFSKKVSPDIVSKVTGALLSLINDDYQQARAVRNKLGIQGYIKKAGVDKSFNFTFK